LTAATFEAALGGPLTEPQRLAVANAAALSAIAEDAQARRLAGDDVSLDDIVRYTSAARRAVRDLGLDNRKREPDPGPTLAEHLARRAAERAGGSGEAS
jgi:hypothetical protein